MRRRCAAAGILALLPLAGSAADIQSLQVTRDNGRYHVEMQVRLHAAAPAAYAAFTDPARLAAINPAVQKVQVLEQPAEDRARLYTEVRVCAMLYCKTLHQVQELRYAPRPDGGDLRAEVLPEQSDFRYGHASWSFRAEGAETRMRFSAELEPGFWIPPVLGPWLVERSLREEAQRTSAGIELQAAAAESKGATLATP
jgi:hypothetical protein